MSDFNSKLKMLPVNKTVIFHSPIENKYNLVRTGTIGEGSCFLHSILHAYSKEYISLNNKERMKFVRRLRASMASNVNKENWEEMGSGLIAKIPFQENVNYTLRNFYNFIQTNNLKGSSTKKIVKKLFTKDDGEIDESKIEFYSLITELLPITVFEQNILPDSYKTSENLNIEQSKYTIVQNTSNYLNKLDTLKHIDSKRAKRIKNLTLDLIQLILDEAEDSAFKSYVKSLSDVTEDIDSYLIGVISDRFNRDIYFIDAKTRMPYRVGGNEDIKNRVSIIILWIGRNHYEIVGKLLPGNIVKREFLSDDPLIEKINTFLFNPEQVKFKYPDLIPYLPKEYREYAASTPSINSELESESESEEDPQYSSSYYSSDSED